MYEISVKTHFSAAHHLRGHGGACLNPHGHNWDVRVTLAGNETNDLGMLLDFSLVKAKTLEIMKELDHRDLNELAVFKEQNPTSENIARHLFDRLGQELNSPRYRVIRVEVGETPATTATYHENDD